MNNQPVPTAATNSAIAGAILDALTQRLEDHQRAINKDVVGHFTRVTFLGGARNTFRPCLNHGNDGKDNKASLFIYFTENYNLRFKCQSSSSCTSKKIEDSIKSLGIEVMGYDGWSPIDPSEAKAVPPTRSPGFWDKIYGKLIPTSNLTSYYRGDGDLNHITCRWDFKDNAGEKAKVIRPLSYCRHETGLIAWRFLKPAKPCLLGEHLLKDNVGRRKLIVEGEKARAAAEKLFPELQVLCYPFGVKAYDEIDWCVLKGEDVTICLDLDKPGDDTTPLLGHKLKETGVGQLRAVKFADEMRAKLCAVKEGWDLADDVPPDVDALLDVYSAVLDAAEYEPPEVLEEFTQSSKKKKTPAYIPQVSEPIWRERKKYGEPEASMHNAMLAITAIGVKCRYDIFHDKILFGFENETFNHALQEAKSNGVSDNAVLALRHHLSDKFGFDLTERFIRDAVQALALEHCFDPVLDMLAEAEAAWDNVPRLATMATTYLNAEDTELNNTCLRKWMIAAVARVRIPGCKFDNILVLESDEGWDKSKFFQVLAGDAENFSDETIIGKQSREVQEHLATIWIHENAELGGMKKAEVEMVKAFASRQVDRARPAYGHFLKSQPRHSVEAGTTNSDVYLMSQTGNRRFWGMKLLKPVNIEKFRQDRLQLLGEAAYYQSKGESVLLDANLWPAAAMEQEIRRATDPWEDILRNIPETVDGEWSKTLEQYDEVRIIHRVDAEEQVTTNDLLRYVLKIPVGQLHHGHTIKLSPIMNRLGWVKSKDKLNLNGGQHNGYRRVLKKPRIVKPLAQDEIETLLTAYADSLEKIGR